MRTSQRLTTPPRGSDPIRVAHPGLWQRLTEPDPSIEEIGARHLARLLSSFLLTACVLSVMATVLATRSGHPGAPWSAVHLAMIMLLYWVSRGRHARVAAYLGTILLSFLPLFSTYFLGLQAGTDSLANVYWLLLGIIFGSMYFATGTMMIMVLFCVLGVWILYLGLPALSFDTFLNAAWLILFVSMFALISNRSQRVIERDRRALIEQRGRDLVQLNRNMEMMLYVVSHDLKEPLRTIQSFSQIVNSRYADRLDHKGQDYLRRVARGSERMRELLDDVVQLLRAQRIALPDTALPGEDIVLAVLERLENRIEETCATVEVAPDLPDLHVQRTWGIAAVQNLVDNALKYVEDGAPPMVEIAPYRGPEGVGLVVLDRGPGVAPEHVDKLFQLFQRGVGREIPGTGAGLAIVRQIARRHGGDAWVRPREGGGAAFYITFQSADAAAAGGSKQQGVVQSSIMGGSSGMYAARGEVDGP